MPGIVMSGVWAEVDCPPDWLDPWLQAAKPSDKTTATLLKLAKIRCCFGLIPVFDEWFIEMINALVYWRVKRS
jgi:hypothetical protein